MNAVFKFRFNEHTNNTVTQGLTRQIGWNHSSHPHCFMQHSIGVVQVLSVFQGYWLVSCKTKSLRKHIVEHFQNSWLLLICRKIPMQQSCNILPCGSWPTHCLYFLSMGLIKVLSTLIHGILPKRLWFCFCKNCFWHLELLAMHITTHTVSSFVFPSCKGEFNCGPLILHSHSPRRFSISCCIFFWHSGFLAM